MAEVWLRVQTVSQLVGAERGVILAEVGSCVRGCLDNVCVPILQLSANWEAWTNTQP
jgi:hypothetical protein